MSTAIEQAIRDFHARVTEAEQVLDVLNDVLEMRPEGRLYSAVWALIGGYLDALDASHPGIGGWLEWWWNECRLGTRPLHAGLAGEELRMIATIDDLVRLVCEDLAVSNTEGTAA